MHQIFGGVLRSEVRCLRCSRVTTRLDPFTNLSLDVTDSSTIGDVWNNTVGWKSCRERTTSVLDVAQHKWQQNNWAYIDYLLVWYCMSRDLNKRHKQLTPSKSTANLQPLANNNPLYKRLTGICTLVQSCTAKF